MIGTGKGCCEKWISVLYEKLMGRVIIGAWIRKIRSRYERIKPADEKTVLWGVMRIFFFQVLLNLVVIYFGCILLKDNLYYAAMAFLIGYFSNHQIMYRLFRKKEIKLLYQMEKFIWEVQHFYFLCHRIEESLADAIEITEYEISLHMNLIYDVLQKEDDELSQSYISRAPNGCFITFLVLCQTALAYGDTIKENGDSVYIESLEELRKEVNMEIMKQEKINYIFSGLIFITVFPLLFLKPIENWAIFNLPELKEYYFGSYGTVVLILVLCVTNLAYQVICFLRDGKNDWSRDYPILEALCRINWVDQYLNHWILTHQNRAEKLNGKLHQINAEITLKQWKLRESLTFGAVSILLFIAFWQVCNLSKRDNQLFILLTGLVLAFVFALFISRGYELVMAVKIYYMKERRQEEIIRFQMIIIMLKKVPEMNLEVILMWLENCSKIFKKAIIECADYLSYDWSQALNQLKETETFPAFVRLVENMELCDCVGVSRAFYDLEEQRKFYLGRWKQEEEIRIHNCGMIAKICACVPCILTMFFYLIVPFVYESISRLLQYTEQLKNMY